MKSSNKQLASHDNDCDRREQPAPIASGSYLDMAEPEARQRTAFAAINKSLDDYRRTPEFLQAMKRQVDALIRAKRNEDATEANEGANEGNEGNDQPDGRWGFSQSETVYREGTLKLLRYRRPQRKRFAEPVLICFSLVNRPYILDLGQGRSVVQQLLKHGFEVYLIDWGQPAPEDSRLGLEDYVGRLVKNAADVVVAHADGNRLNLLGYCMGGTMAAIYASLYPAQIRNLILLAAPIDFGGDEGLLNLWTREEVFDVDGLIAAYANCPGPFLQYCFQLMAPATSLVEKLVMLGENVNNPAFLDNFLATERWSRDNIPVAGKTFLQFVKLLYRKNCLVGGTLHLNETPIQLANISCPVLLLVAENDHLVPPSATSPFRQHISSVDVKTMTLDSGHIGLAVSSKAHQRLWPPAAGWIADRSTPLGEKVAVHDKPRIA
ncbi:alpha/beta fold hydrolase [Pirellulales bacterium]|nr:alpha/beta fold hydrolase [Pirellulales bacterium]